MHCSPASCRTPSHRSTLERLYRRVVSYGLFRARIHMKDGNPYRAMRLLELVGKSARHVPIVHLRLAAAATACNDIPVLRNTIREAVPLAQKAPSVANRLALFQLDLDDLSGAVETLATASKRFPSSWKVWNLHGHILGRRSDLVGAKRCIQRAIELAPTLRTRMFCTLTLAEMLGYFGAKEEATSLLRQIVRSLPQMTLAHCKLVDSDLDANACQPYADDLVALLELPGLDVVQRRQLHYSLGHLYDRSDQPGKAFAHYHLANELRARMTQPADLDELRRQVGARVTLFQRQRIEALANRSCNDESLIFVVGMPRSGTTLVEQILTAHPDISGLGERRDIYFASQALRSKGRRAIRYPWCVETMSPRDFEAISQALTKERRQDAGPCLRIVSKLPEDFWDLGLIAILFPNARIVHCRRHAIDTCLSCYMRNFEHIPYSTSLEQLAEVYRLYRHIMAHWRAQLPEGSMLELSYEDLVNGSDELVKQLCNFCDVPFASTCLSFHESRRMVMTASHWQVRRPLYQSSIGRWKRYREFLGPLLSLEDVR
jgi:tetratricopeptide (TPR) repeat protein